jgi:hypothetical protein
LKESTIYHAKVKKVIDSFDVITNKTSHKHILLMTDDKGHDFECWAPSTFEKCLRKHGLTEKEHMWILFEQSPILHDCCKSDVM